MVYGLSTNLQYWQERINLFVALAPVVSMKHCSSNFIKFVRNFDGLLKWMYLKFKTLEIFNMGKKFEYDGGVCWIIPGCRKIANFLEAVSSPFED